MRNKNFGFTLIELLVVISIIGLLTSVVLAALKTAKDKAADAGIIQSMTNIRSQAAIYYSNNNNSYGPTYYGTANIVGPYDCANAIATANTMFADSKIYQILTAIGQLNGIGIGGTNAQCCSGPGGYEINVKLKTAGNLWTVDSTGKSYAQSGALLQPTPFCGNGGIATSPGGGG